MSQNFDDLITAQDVGEILGWDMQKVYRMAREGRIPVARKLGHVFLFLRPDIEAYARGNGTPAVAIEGQPMEVAK